MKRCGNTIQSSLFDKLFEFIKVMRSNYLSKKMKHINIELVQYLSETTIHGFRYLVESRNNLERLIWGITICLSMFVAIKMVAENCIYAIENPIITNIETVEIQKVMCLL